MFYIMKVWCIKLLSCELETCVWLFQSSKQFSSWLPYLKASFRRHRKTSTSAPTNHVLCPMFNHLSVVDFGLKSYMHVHRRWYLSRTKRDYHNEMWLDMDIFISTGKCVVCEKITFLLWLCFWLFFWELYCTDSYLKSSWKLYPC